MNQVYRVYLRAPDQAVTHKKVTSEPDVARAAFRALTDRTDLDGTPMLAVLNRDGRPLAHHRFDGLDPLKSWRGCTDEIDMSKPV